MKFILNNGLKVSPEVPCYTMHNIPMTNPSDPQLVLKGDSSVTGHQLSRLQSRLPVQNYQNCWGKANNITLHCHVVITWKTYLCIHILYCWLCFTSLPCSLLCSISNPAVDRESPSSICLSLQSTVNFALRRCKVEGRGLCMNNYYEINWEPGVNWGHHECEQGGDQNLHQWTHQDQSGGR